MPTYVFRCTEGCEFDASYPVAGVPSHTSCRHCGSSARKIFTPPYLSRSGSAAYRLIDRTVRSADEPEVVQRLPARPAGRAPKYTTNPLHAKLPRP